MRAWQQRCRRSRDGNGRCALRIAKERERDRRRFLSGRNRFRTSTSTSKIDQPRPAAAKTHDAGARFRDSRRGSAPRSFARPAAAIESNVISRSIRNSTFEPDAVGAGRTVAYDRRDQARSRQGVPGDGRRRRGARSCRKVLHEGDDQQKAEARRLARQAQQGAVPARAAARLAAFFIPASFPPRAHRSRYRVRRRGFSRAGNRRPTGPACRTPCSAESLPSPAMR